MNSWISWSNRLLEVGFSRFYETWSDYLPGYLWVHGIDYSLRSKEKDKIH